MGKGRFIFLTAVMLVFISCEKEVLSPEIQEAQLRMQMESQKAKKVLSFKAHLTGDQEVPAVETKATGQAIFKLSKDGAELSYKLIVANIENVHMAHIHYAPTGSNGPVVVWLYPTDGPPPSLIEGRKDGILAEGIITEDDLRGALTGESLEELLEGMIAGNTYVNVHTIQNPAGEIRGQIAANNVK